MQKSKKQIAVETIDKPENREGPNPGRHTKSLEIAGSRGFLAFIGFPEIFITPSVKEYFYKE
jgi:hypothetical protein